MDDKTLDRVLGWLWDTTIKADELSVAAFAAGIDLDKALDFFEPDELLDAIAGRPLIVGFFDAAAESKEEFIAWARREIRKAAEEVNL